MASCKIAFWAPALKTDKYTNAIFDYAHYNQTILHNESIIIYNKRNTENDQETIRRFRDHFPPSKIHPVNHWLEVDPFLVKSNTNILYLIHQEEAPPILSQTVRNAVHCTNHIFHEFGDATYAAISPTIHGYSVQYHNLVIHPEFYQDQEAPPQTPESMMKQFRQVFIFPNIPI